MLLEQSQDQVMNHDFGSNSLPSPQPLGLIYTGILQGHTEISN